MFQSTRPRGARPVTFNMASPAGVSIHAPTWGATGRKTHDMLAKRFNPRAHVGRDVEAKAEKRAIEFQSTRPRGARRYYL